MTTPAYAFLSPWQVVPLTAPASTLDTGTTIGMARVLIPDLAGAIFSDAQLAVFQSVEGEDARLVAAAALETMAANVAYVYGDTRVEDLQTNGSKTSDALIKRAKSLRELALNADAESGDSFDWAEMVLDPFTLRERLWDQRLRGVV